MGTGRRLISFPYQVARATSAPGQLTGMQNGKVGGRSVAVVDELPRASRRQPLPSMVPKVNLRKTAETRNTAGARHKVAPRDVVAVTLPVTLRVTRAITIGGQAPGSP